MPGASRSILIDAPIETVFGIITDYEKYPEFLSEVKAIRVSERREGEAVVQYEVSVLKTIRYTLKLKEEKPQRISWSLVEGELMRENKGSWLLEPQGKQTRATYSIEMTLGPLVPKAMVNALVDSSLPKMLESFKKRAVTSALTIALGTSGQRAGGQLASQDVGVIQKASRGEGLTQPVAAVGIRNYRLGREVQGNRWVNSDLESLF